MFPVMSFHSAAGLEKFIATCSGKTGDANVVNERLLIYYVSECVVAIVCVNNVGYRRSIRKPKIELKRNTKKSELNEKQRMRSNRRTERLETNLLTTKKLQP